MDLEQLQTLRDRVAQATSQDRETDRALMRMSWLADEVGDFDRYWHQGPQVRFTASIDAALAWVERVLPEWGWDVSSCDGVVSASVIGPVFNTSLFGDDPTCDDREMFTVRAPTPALAIILAGLDTLIAKEKTND